MRVRPKFHPSCKTSSYVDIYITRLIPCFCGCGSQQKVGVSAYKVGLRGWVWGTKDFSLADLREAFDIFTVIIHGSLHICWIYVCPGKALLYLHKSTINKAHLPSSTHHIALELEEVNIGPGKYNILCLWSLPIFLTFIIFQNYAFISIFLFRGFFCLLFWFCFFS